MKSRWIVAIAAALVLSAYASRRDPATAFSQRAATATATATSPAEREKAVDAVFAKWTASTPGCAVGVSSAGTPVLVKGYGMADLEHDVPIGADTIVEGGSVSKQFTAAAVLL